MKLIPAQRRSFRRSDARINLWAGPVRNGKTFCSMLRWIDYITDDAPAGEFYMLGKTISTLKRNIIGPLQEFLGDAMRYSSAKNEISLFGRTVHTVGAATELAESRLRGATAAGAYCDEASLYPESVWTMLLSRLSVPGAKLFATTNPDSPGHWLKTNYIDRALGHMKVFEWSLDEAVRCAENPNGFLEPEFVNAIKSEYTGLWRKRFIDGLWVLAEGAIYDMFNEERHVIETPLYKRPDYYIVGVDYGTGNPTCFEMIAVRRQHKRLPICWAEGEYYYDSKASSRQKTDAEYAKDMKHFLDRHRMRQGSMPVPIMAIYVDPSAASFKLELRRAGLLTVRDADNDVLNGIRTVSTMLHQGRYKLCRSCKHTIKEYGGYVWDPKKSQKGIDEPVKSNDHAKDAERYALHSHFGSDRLTWSEAALAL